MAASKLFYPVLQGDQASGAVRFKITIQARQRGATLAQRQITLASINPDPDAAHAVDAIAAACGALFGWELPGASSH